MKKTEATGYGNGISQMVRFREEYTFIMASDMGQWKTITVVVSFRGDTLFTMELEEG